MPSTTKALASLFFLIILTSLPAQKFLVRLNETKAVFRSFLCFMGPLFCSHSIRSSSLVVLVSNLDSPATATASGDYTTRHHAAWQP